MISKWTAAMPVITSSTAVWLTRHYSRVGMAKLLSHNLLLHSSCGKDEFN